MIAARLLGKHIGLSLRDERITRCLVYSRGLLVIEYKAELASIHSLSAKVAVLKSLAVRLVLLKAIVIQ